MSNGIDEATLKSKHSEETEELRRQLDEKDRRLQEYRKEHGKLEVFFHSVLAKISSILPLPRSYSPVLTKGKFPIVAVMQISDGHMGAVQEADEIEGFGEFNPSIADMRNLDYARRFIKWVQVQRNGYAINEVTVLVTGDLISGDIHDELRITNAFPSPEQVVRAASIHAQQIIMMAPHFEKITVEFITEDNHARMTKKPQAKEAGKNSLNYLVGILMQGYLASHTNVEFNIYPMLEKVVTVNERQYLISHGHGVRGWMGIPWYGVERKVGRESQARMQMIMQNLNDEMTMAREIGFHKYVFGHFHTPFNSTLYSCSGSVSGTDAYDHINGRHANPSQSSWLVHPRYGEFNRIDFNLK